MIDTRVHAADIVVNSVAYPRNCPENGGWVILRTNIGTVKGTLPYAPKPGMKLTVTGQYEVYHGQKQFKFYSAKQTVPIDELSLLDYAASMAKGVGEVTVYNIRKEFGRDWQKHLDDMPPKVANALQRALDTINFDKVKLQTITYAMALGASPRIGELAYIKWRGLAVSVMESDPYRLTELNGIGFKTVDMFMKARCDTPEKLMKRAQAAIMYILSDDVDTTGNTVMALAELMDTAQRDYGLALDVSTAALKNLIADKAVEMVETDYVVKRAFATMDNAIVTYATKPRKIDDSVVPSRTLDTKTLDDSQYDAVKNCVQRDGLSIINGAAGCGKTTIIKAIYKNLDSRGERVNLCAFAGKAAARLREATGCPASTIHSLLMWQGDGNAFGRPTLEGETVIVDEASMIPTSLMFEIVKRNPARLILVGDQSQIQPVGAGQPFHDLIYMLPMVVNTVTTCYRNDEAIYRQALKIRSGIVPESERSEKESFEIKTFRNSDDIQKYIETLARLGEIDFTRDLVLSPRNGEGDEPMRASVGALNKSLQQIVNPHLGNEKFRVLDRVIGTKNFPRLSLWNGSAATVSRIDIDGIPYITLDDEPLKGEVRMTPEAAATLAPAYCLTVHKAQGSQYRKVICVILNRDTHSLLDRSLLYTAVTRAKSDCVILTDTSLSTVCMTVRHRKTYLQILMQHTTKEKTNG